LRTFGRAGRVGRLLRFKIRSLLIQLLLLFISRFVRRDPERIDKLSLPAFAFVA
jgi:hypothetical protein